MGCNFNMGEDGRNIYLMIMLEVRIPLTTFNWHIGFERFLVMYLLFGLHHHHLDLHHQVKIVYVHLDYLYYIIRLCFFRYYKERK